MGVDVPMPVIGGGLLGCFGFLVFTILLIGNKLKEPDQEAYLGTFLMAYETQCTLSSLPGLATISEVEYSQATRQCTWKNTPNAISCRVTIQSKGDADNSPATHQAYVLATIDFDKLLKLSDAQTMCDNELAGGWRNLAVTNFAPRLEGDMVHGECGDLGAATCAGPKCPDTTKCQHHFNGGGSTVTSCSMELRNGSVTPCLVNPSGGVAFGTRGSVIQQAEDDLQETRSWITACAVLMVLFGCCMCMILAAFARSEGKLTVYDF